MRFLHWFLRDDLLEEVEGDLEEKFLYTIDNSSLNKARMEYWFQVFQYLRPFAITKKRFTFLSNTDMVRNYLKIGWRNLFKNLGYSTINIGGMALGLATVLLIGLWVHDELTFDDHFENRSMIGQVMRTATINGDETYTVPYLPYALSEILNEEYSHYFTHVINIFPEGNIVLRWKEESYSEVGTNMDPGVITSFGLDMLSGNEKSLNDPYSIIISESLADKIFQGEEPIGQILTVSNRNDVKVTGVFRDQPHNSSLYGLEFILPTELNLINNPWKREQGLTNNFLKLYVQIAPGYTFEEVSQVISEVIYEGIKDSSSDYAQVHPRLFIHPMEKWHLYGDWNIDGVNTGRIRFVRLFGTIGIFILLLACINFMNLSTARSDKRAKEVGIRKSIGSRKKQLVYQFLVESCMLVCIAFLLALIIATLSIDSFNNLADKQVQIPWTSPVFWGISLVFILVTGTIAGSYPSFYLSSFNPVRILKGTFKTGRTASLPRQILVVVQFTVSVVLIIGTLVVYQQIQHAKNRPVGYEREGLVLVEMSTKGHREKFETIKSELLATGDIDGVAMSLGPVTNVWSSNGGFSWNGKAPSEEGDFATISVSAEFGDVVKWNFVDGRNFSPELPSDSGTVVLNETAVRLLGIEEPVGEVIRYEPSWAEARNFEIIGVIQDVIMRSPYTPNMPTAYFLNDAMTHLSIRIKEGVAPSDGVASMEATFKKIFPNVPFTYEFADESYAAKFADEERVGKLSSIFAVLAIIISCLGLFGMAAFVAEQKTKEIGIRKVVGASVFSLWRLQANKFMWLVIIGSLIAIPIAYVGMSEWLEMYEYRINLQWWVFAAAMIGALLITIITISYQALRAASLNPVKSLRSD